jgi:hypothetical protein
LKVISIRGLYETAAILKDISIRGLYETAAIYQPSRALTFVFVKE